MTSYNNSENHEHHSKSSSGSEKHIKSAQSLGSIGIGSDISKSKLHLPFKLVPEGLVQVHSSLFDCIMFIIYCPEHDHILMNNNAHTKIAWLPFVVLQEGNTWSEASHDGINSIIGRKDAELDTEQAEYFKPCYRMSYLHIMRIQSTTERFYLRITQFVKLEKSSNFKCCQNSNHLVWFRAADLLNDKINNCWAPEVKILTARMISKKPSIIEEFTLEQCLHYLKQKHSCEKSLLMTCKIKAEYIIEIYEDYLNHSYPALYMCYRSFKSYLVKYGFEPKDKRLRYLFNACMQTHRSYIDFNDFLIGIICMEPSCDSKLEARARFIFRYYDIEKDKNLNSVEFTAMLQDINPDANEHEFKKILEHKAKEIGVKRNTIPYENYKNAIESGCLDVSKLCRSTKPILPQISKLLQLKHDNRNVCLETSTHKRKGNCVKCRTPDYKYNTHCVTFNTVGECVKPRNISRKWDSDEGEDDTAAINYSKECVFSNNYIPNILLDLIEHFYYSHKLSNLSGLLCHSEDHDVLLYYVQSLCHDLDAILLCEKKLLNINSPAFVIGDLRGSLHSLIEMQKKCFSTFPVLVENLIFLGNYYGEMKYGVECLLYVFALKVLQPNKVFLLRGLHEGLLNDDNYLRSECLKKYGNKTGTHVYHYLVDIFEKLPFAAIVDETIACVHSGFPSKCRIEKLLELPHSVHSVQTNAPFAYEILFTYPKKKNGTQSSEEIGFSQISSKLGDQEYHKHIFSRVESGETISSNASSLTSGATPSDKSRIKAMPSRGINKQASLHSLKSYSRSSTKQMSRTMADNNIKSKQSVSSKKSLEGSISQEAAQSTPSSADSSSTSSNATLSKSNKSVQHNKIHCTPNIMPNKQTYGLKRFTLFLKSHQFRFLIRSQSVCQNGFKLNFRGKCLTVFSCARFNHSDDKIGIIHINDSTNQIRFMTLENS